jgi:ATPase family AAA domain-containing protein 3A/B
MSFLRGEQAPPPAIDVAPDVTDELFEEAARKTEGFSGRELAKLMNAVQAAVYGSPPPRLLAAATFSQVVDHKVREHAQKRDIVAAGAAADTAAAGRRRQ